MALEYSDKIAHLCQIVDCRLIEIVPQDSRSLSPSPIDYRSKISFELEWNFDDSGMFVVTNIESLQKQMSIVKGELATILRLTANFPIIFPERRNTFMKVGLWMKMNQYEEIMLKWVFYYTPKQFSNIHSLVNDWLSAWWDFYSYHVSHSIVSVYYQLENSAERGKVETKKKDYYLWRGLPQLREKIHDFEYFISPDRFTQVNWYTQKIFYDLLLREIQYSTPFIPVSWGIAADQYPIAPSRSIIRTPRPKRVLFTFGRDIGAITLLFAPYFQHIRGFTYCPVVHKDCEQNWKQYARQSDEDPQKAIYHYSPRAKLYKSFLEPLSYPEKEQVSYVLVWSSGRHGLKMPELQWLKSFVSTQYVESMVYISCNLKTLQRDLEWIARHLPRCHRIRKIHTLDQFPGTEYLETHVWWDFY